MHGVEMKRLGMVGLTVWMAACAGSQQGSMSAVPASQTHESVLRDTAPIYGPRLFGALCNGQESAPARQETAMYGVKVEQPCGMMVSDMGPSAYAPSARCRGLVDEACADPTTSAFVSRLHARYTGADLRTVAARCRAAPEACDSFAELERQYLVTHNDAVFRDWERDVNARRAAIRQAETERRKHEQRASGTLGDALFAGKRASAR